MTRRLVPIWIVVFATWLLAATAGAAGSEPDAAWVGTAVCRACHPVETDHWSATVHARLVGRQPRAARGCEDCHGPGSLHVKDPADGTRIVAFTRDSSSSVQAMNAMCLECHSGGTRLRWDGSVHELETLACSDCHNPMAALSARGLPARKGISETCFTCHPTQRAQFRKRSHMPLLEGKITCSDCHAPHGSSSDTLLRGDTVNQLCFRCHAEKRGPFLWEHAPVTESCSNCHEPHGSNHDDLLTAPAPFLCNACHGQLGGFGHPNDLLVRGNLASGRFPDERILGRGCVNCHSQIHGSNHPSGARFHR